MRQTISKYSGKDPFFRWRGEEISRIESFSDSVFAFAITLVIVSLEVPKSFAQMRDVMQGFIGFAACFSLMLWIWYEHYIFFRRYGLSDKKIIVLNAALLFVVLFYSFPLKFVFGFLFSRFLGLEQIQSLTLSESKQMMYFFNAGFLAVEGIFFMFYRHAWSLRVDLELTDIEIFDTKTAFIARSASIGVGVLSTLIILSGGDQWTAVGGFTYWIIGPCQWFIGATRGKKRRQLELKIISLKG